MKNPEVSSNSNVLQSASGALAWAIDLIAASFYLAAAAVMLGTAFAVILVVILLRNCLLIALFFFLVVPGELMAVSVPSRSYIIRRWVAARMNRMRSGPLWWSTWRGR